MIGNIRTPLDLSETGQWHQDNALGRELADELIQHMRDRAAPNLLSSIMREVVGTGRWGGIEVGFATRMAMHAL